MFHRTDCRGVGTLVTGNGFVWCPTRRTMACRVTYKPEVITAVILKMGTRIGSRVTRQYHVNNLAEL